MLPASVDVSIAAKRVHHDSHERAVRVDVEKSKDGPGGTYVFALRGVPEAGTLVAEKLRNMPEERDPFSAVFRILSAGWGPEVEAKTRDVLREFTASTGRAKTCFYDTLKDLISRSYVAERGHGRIALTDLGATKFNNGAS